MASTAHAYGADPEDMTDKAIYMTNVTGDTEKDAVSPEFEEAAEFMEVRDLKQGLQQRHIQMIALAGTIGTGLFLSSGNALATGGPLGAFLGYTLTGIIVAGVVLSVAELSALIPLSGGVIRHAEYLVDPALSFAIGWNKVYSALVTIPAEITAAAVIVSFWKEINNAVWISVFGALLFAANMFLVRIYGELEFTFAILKILLIVGQNIMALVITCGGGPNHETYGFRYWRHPGPFVQYLGIGGSLGRFLGFWSTFNNAAYAYGGMDDITVVASETKAPRRNIPKAAKRIFVRVLLFYSVSIFMVTLLVASDDQALLDPTKSGTAAQSPFVIAAERAGIHAVPSIINVVVLTSAWSAGNESLLGGSRILYGLAQHGHAPRFFRRTNRFSIPYVCVMFVGIFVCLGYMTLSDSASTVFTWFQDLVSSAILMGWTIICIVYLRFYYAMKKQGISRDELPWKSPFQPYMCWACFFMLAIILLTGGYTVFIHHHWDSETFISAYLDLVIVPVLYVGYKIVYRTRIIPLDEVPVRRFIEIANRNPEPPEKPKKGLHKLNILWS